jgi:hypothetical protein
MPRPDRRIRAPQPRRPAHQAPENTPLARRAASNVSTLRHYLAKQEHHEKRMIPRHHGKDGQYEVTVPTVADRIAQTVAAMYLERRVEPVFHPDSYGYRPGRSALDAVGVCRRRCWQSDWIVDLDIRAFFDSVDHELMIKAVERHVDAGGKWVLLYVKRWLIAPLARPDGTVQARDRGTPQGGLCNAFHNDPYEQCRVMRSAGLLALVTATLGVDRCA